MTTDIEIPNEFSVYSDDYHEFANICMTLSKTLGLIYTHKEIDSDRPDKPYMAWFTLKGIRHPAQYSGR